LRLRRIATRSLSQSAISSRLEEDSQCANQRDLQPNA
jgi:hypothetical protein